MKRILCMVALLLLVPTYVQGQQPIKTQATTPQGDSTVNETANSMRATIYDANGNVAIVPEGAAFTAGDPVIMMAIRACGTTPSIGSGVATGDRGVPCVNDKGALIIALSAPDGTMPVPAPDAVKGAAAPSSGPAMFAEADDTSTAAVTEGNSGSLRLNPTSRALLTYQDGATLKRYLSAGSTEDESQVKATAGVLLGISARNSHATTIAYIKCTNLTAANTTPGSSTIFYEMIVPPAGGVVDRNINAVFDTALTCYIVTGKTDADATEVAAGDVSYNLTYR